MAREILGYWYDPDSKRYFKEDKNVKRIPPHKDARSLTHQLWRWHQDEHEFRSTGPSLSSALASFQLSGKHKNCVIPPRVKIIESAYPIWWDTTHQGIGLYFQENRILRRLDVAEGTVTSPVFDGNRIFQQSNYLLCTAAFRHGVLLCSFRDHLEDMWETCFLRFERFESRTEYSCVEARIRRDDIGGPFQAAEICPKLHDNSPIFLIGSGNRLIKGQCIFNLPNFTEMHAFDEPEEILSIKSCPNGLFAFVSCSGGIITMVEWDSMRMMGAKMLKNNEAARIIVSVDASMKVTVVTFHDRILEIDFSSWPAAQCAHSITLAPFKDPSLGPFKVVVAEDGAIWTTQKGSDHVSAWRWSSPSQPAQTIHMPNHSITDIDVGADGELLVLSVSK